MLVACESANPARDFRRLPAVRGNRLFFKNRDHHNGAHGGRRHGRHGDDDDGDSHGSRWSGDVSASSNENELQDDDDGDWNNNNFNSKNAWSGVHSSSEESNHKKSKPIVMSNYSRIHV